MQEAASAALPTPAEAFIPTRKGHAETMEKEISLEERVADLERELADLSLSIDEQPARDAWLNDIEFETPQAVFKILVVYLSSLVPGFSVDELRRLTESILLTTPPVTGIETVVRDQYLQRARAIIGQMLP